MASNQEEFGSGGSCVIHESREVRGGAVETQQIELALPASSGEAVDGSLRRTHFPALQEAKANSGASSAATAGSVRARIPSSSMKTRPGSRVLQEKGKAYTESPRFITTPSPSGSVSLLGVTYTRVGDRCTLSLNVPLRRWSIQKVRRMTSSSFVFQETKVKRVSASFSPAENESDAEWLPLWAKTALEYLDSFRPGAATLYNSAFIQIVMFIATVYALFIDDLRIVAFPKSADEGLNVFLSIIFFLFIIEIIVLGWIEDGYIWDGFLGVYFVLDLLAAVSIVFDLPWMDEHTETLAASVGGGSGAVGSGTGVDDLEIAKAGRAAKVGSKTARFAKFVRLIRILRLLRLFRLAKYMKSSGSKSSLAHGNSAQGSSFSMPKDDGDDDNDDDDNDDIDSNSATVNPSLEEDRNYKQHQETSKKMADDVTDQVSQRVVLLVLIVMVTVSFLQPSDEDTTRQSGMLMIYAMNVTASSSLDYLKAYNDTVNSYMQTRNLLYLKTFGEVHKPFPASEEALLRTEEIHEITVFNATNGIDNNFLAKFDDRNTMKHHATLNLVLVLLTIFYLLAASYVFSSDALRVVGAPLDDMLRANGIRDAVLSVFKAVSSEMSVDVVVDTIVKSAKRVFTADKVHLYFYNRMKRRLWCKARHDGHAIGDKIIEFHVDQDNFAGRCAATGETINVSVDQKSGTKISLRNVDDDVDLYNVRNMLCMSVLDTDNHCIAVVQVLNKEKGIFSPSDEDLLRSYCDQIALLLKRKSLEAVYASVFSNVSNTQKNSMVDTTVREMLLEYSKHDNTDSLEFGLKYNKKRSDPRGLGDNHDRRTSASLISGSPLMVKMKDVRTELQERCCIWDFNVFSYDINRLSYLSVAILYDVGSFQEFTIDATSAVNFMESVSKGYGDPEEVPYHNFYHAFSVMHVVWRLLTTTKSATSLTALDKLGSCIAAVCHDMGHKGRNNQFHMNCLEDDQDIPELALTYNDVSVLEMYHASRCYQTLRIPGNDIFKFLSKTQRKEMRSIIIHAILGTDMAHHFERTAKFQAQKTYDVNNKDDRQMLVDTLLHAADLSNPVLAQELSVIWSCRVAQEFQAQARMEREMGFSVTPHYDISGPAEEANPAVAKLNVNFIDFVVAPLWIALEALYPNLHGRLEVLTNNREMWKTRLELHQTIIQGGEQQQKRQQEEVRDDEEEQQQQQERKEGGSSDLGTGEEKS